MSSLPVAPASEVGFVGLGVMGQPMALNLQRAGVQLTVWNRTPERCAPLVAAGAKQAASLDEVFGSVRTIILMLADERSTDAVLGRGGDRFASRVAGKRIIVMGTNSPAWSERLAGDLLAAGADYVEAPVSGSRQPAIEGKLVAMVAATDASTRSDAVALISPMCQATFDAGPVPGALRLKIAVNLYLITMVAGLAEAAALASALGVGWPLLRSVLDAGPMASEVSRMKLAKLVAEDFSVQASIRDVLMNCRLVADAAQAAAVEASLLTRSMHLFDRAHREGLGGRDMIGVIDAIRAAPSAAGAVIAEQLAAYNARDLDRFMGCWHEDATFGVHPGLVRFRGAAEIREHHRRRFEDPSLNAVLVSRTVVSDVVVDHEWVTLGARGGLRHFEVVAIYTVADGRIATASFRQEERSADRQGGGGKGP
jgi:3-hydroxyisobutyrate dehydrogenase